MSRYCCLQYGKSWCQGVAIYSVETRSVKVLLSTVWEIVVSRCCYLQRRDSWCQGVAVYSMGSRGVKVFRSTLR